jgi:hypothetical protein
MAFTPARARLLPEMVIQFRATRYSLALPHLPSLEVCSNRGDDTFLNFLNSSIQSSTVHRGRYRLPLNAWLGPSFYSPASDWESPRSSDACSVTIRTRSQSASLANVSKGSPQESAALARISEVPVLDSVANVSAPLVDVPAPTVCASAPLITIPANGLPGEYFVHNRRKRRLGQDEGTFNWYGLHFICAVSL